MSLIYSDNFLFSGHIFKEMLTSWKLNCQINFDLIISSFLVIILLKKC